MKTFRWLRACAPWLGVLLMTPWLPLQAQTYPAHPVTMVGTQPAGGSTDLTLRLVADHFRKITGQQMIVDPKPGAAGGVALAYLRRQKPDGYTLSLSGRSAMSWYWVQKQGVGYHPIDDFTYIGTVAAAQLALVSRAGSPFKTLDDVVRLAKQNPGKYTFATIGHGSIFHQPMVTFAEKADISLHHVPYRGDVQSLGAVYSGEIDLAVVSGTFQPWVDDKRLNLIAVMSSKRNPRYPQTPTFDELGYAVSSIAPVALAGPKGMDPAVVSFLQDVLRRMSDDPAFRERLAELGQLPLYLNARETTEWATAQFAREREIVDRFKLAAP
jgi:tripartite-type tricarboxylate transporter receptor subunit TctC